MALFTRLCWNSTQYELAESGMGCVHGRWLAHMSRFFDATAAYTIDKFEEIVEQT